MDPSMWGRSNKSENNPVFTGELLSITAQDIYGTVAISLIGLREAVGSLLQCFLVRRSTTILSRTDIELRLEVPILVALFCIVSTANASMILRNGLRQPSRSHQHPTFSSLR